ncbi:hypothetical protein [Methanobrevibacter thaueri]|uniref:Uncharacterized protein n=1 Tax=Methanobrevibacter thaueri TaxID=190975 RepID=A0A315XNG9_9EURY|nr:hypothetical protein [Methanobrevibacter thaueri]PWB87886.1 hypothetical protein MBBTH_04730 [Methanobrevibacter thaueri]
MARVMLKPKSKYQKYFNPKRIGENVQGNIINQVEDEYGNTCLVLDVGTDENGDIKTTTLPAHQSLMDYYDQLEMGDYIYVELVDLVERKDREYPIKIYAVGIEEDKKKEV